MSRQTEIEVKIALHDHALEVGVMELGVLSIFTCPDCHGTLLQLREGPLLRFRCHTGHAFSLNTLLTGITKSADDSLWNALHVIEESEMLLRHMSGHLRDAGHDEAADALSQKAQDHRLVLLRSRHLRSLRQNLRRQSRPSCRRQRCCY